MDLPFPADLAALARTVRERITAQVGALTGTRVTEVVVVVERLVAGEGHERAAARLRRADGACRVR
ncbi:hypothetical protein ACFQ0M_33760 [Kitasatospora aburaviensis]